MAIVTPTGMARLGNIFFYRLVRELAAPQEKVLNLYAATIDRIIRLDDRMLQTGIHLAAGADGLTPAEVADELAEIETSPQPAMSKTASRATDILKAAWTHILLDQEHAASVTIDGAKPWLLDFLQEWFLAQSERIEQIGGAPALTAQVLRRAGVAVAFWPLYLSPHQAQTFDAGLEGLVVNDTGFATRFIGGLGNPGHPEIHNYAIEFETGAAFHLQGSAEAALERKAAEGDRTLVISPGYFFFDPAGRVIQSRRPPSFPYHLLSQQPFDPRQAGRIAQIVGEYRRLFIGGLQMVQDPACQQSLELDLRALRAAGATIHSEIPGIPATPWYLKVLRDYVPSAGVNMQALESLARSVQDHLGEEARGETPPPRLSAPDLRYDYQARLLCWLACELNLERLHGHSQELSLVARRAPVTDAEMEAEVAALMFATQQVINRAADRAPAGALGVPEQTDLPESNLKKYVDACAMCAFLAERERLTDVLDRGWFDYRFDWRGRPQVFKVAIVPTAALRGRMPGLRWVGAGDTVSAVSFVYSRFRTNYPGDKPDMLHAGTVGGAH